MLDQAGLGHLFFRLAQHFSGKIYRSDVFAHFIKAPCELSGAAAEIQNRVARVREGSRGHHLQQAGVAGKWVEIVLFRPCNIGIVSGSPVIKAGMV